jgi:hypothetical protein
VGFNEGVTVGLRVGRREIVGLCVGSSVGAREGFCEGAWVGLRVGPWLGARVGVQDGILVGRNVGGFCDGLRVGVGPVAPGTVGALVCTGFNVG